jgi:hypothetical protein
MVLTLQLLMNVILLLLGDSLVSEFNAQIFQNALSFHLHRSCLVHMTHADRTGCSKAFTLTIQIMGESPKRKNTTK